MADPHGPDVYVPAALERFCVRQFPGEFTGLVVDQDQAGYTIYRTSGNVLDDAVRTRFPQVRLTFRDAAHSARHLAAAAEQITADWDYWRAQGVRIHAVGPQPSGHVLVSSSTTDLARERLPRRYPGIPLHIEEGGPIAFA